MIDRCFSVIGQTLLRVVVSGQQEKQQGFDRRVQQEQESAMSQGLDDPMILLAAVLAVGGDGNSTLTCGPCV